ncbi:myb family transcription factor PHL7-like isoform X11 [Nymphaea colorata]|uniref:myb family transcription factor PHL7-like isoform X11 n=1 Tax=Nymphaea colorata TaxID=210225 RepID=UPI00214E0A04|nr:myb family transcription factor PHL7-like isoform X11 [Nymphaea colorata]
MHHTRRFPIMGLVPHKPQGAEPLASIGILGEPTVNNSATQEEGAKQRLRWTSDLHERFVNAITQLGGPDRATPKGVLTMMGVPGLTIYHVKSHLQYRLAKFLPESSADVSGSKDEKEGSAGSMSNMENLPSMRHSESRWRCKRDCKNNLSKVSCQACCSRHQKLLETILQLAKG